MIFGTTQGLTRRTIKMRPPHLAFRQAFWCFFDGGEPLIHFDVTIALPVNLSSLIRQPSLRSFLFYIILTIWIRIVPLIQGGAA